MPGLAGARSAASRGSASRRCCSRPRPGSPGPRSGRRVLYATGEESPGQVRLRGGPPRAARRRRRASGSRSSPSTTSGGSSRSPEPSDRRSSSSIRSRRRRVDELDGAAGSVGQVRESALRLMELAKGDGIAVVLVGHVTKDGSIAGPKTLEHLVDAVLNLEGERLRRPAPAPRLQEPVRVDRRDRRVRDGRRAA